MKTPPFCKAPDAQVSAPDFELPKNACDCHFHIFDEPSKQVLPRTYTAPPASIEQLARAHSMLGISRSVVVQPSIYGTDNTAAKKAIVVVEDTASMTTLIDLKNAGAVGCRVNLLSQSNAKSVNLETLAHKASELDWHLQLLVDVSEFENLETTIRALGVPVVFDHMGHMASHKGINNPGFQQMLSLLGDGLAWVKLSGAYRLVSTNSDGTHLNYSDINPIVEALLSTNPDQLVWHTMPNDTDLLNLLNVWVPDKSLRDNILARNPEKLYGF